MLTLAILISALAQPAVSLAGPDEALQKYRALEGQYVEIGWPQEAVLPQGWPADGHRSGKLKSVQPSPRNRNWFLLEIEWDEPWNPAAADDTLTDTVPGRDNANHKLVILPEDDARRTNRIVERWKALGFSQIGSNPLDPAAWIPTVEFDYAKRALELAQANEQRQAARPDPSTAAAPSATPPAPPPAPKFTEGRLPQLVVAAATLALAGVALKTLS